VQLPGLNTTGTFMKPGLSF